MTQWKSKTSVRSRAHKTLMPNSLQSLKERTSSSSKSLSSCRIRASHSFPQRSHRSLSSHRSLDRIQIEQQAWNQQNKRHHKQELDLSHRRNLSQFSQSKYQVVHRHQEAVKTAREQEQTLVDKAVQAVRSSRSKSMSKATINLRSINSQCKIRFKVYKFTLSSRNQRL